MAIDGTKIIDSDLAHDVYNELIELYDNGLEIEEIRKKLNQWHDQDLESVEFEIYITAFALALWEIGQLDESLLREVEQTVGKNAGVKMWLDESGKKDSQARERTLQKFLQKIRTPKTQPRKRKPNKVPANLLFSPDDVVSFQMADGSFRAAIIVGIEQIRRETVYQFTPTSFEGLKPAATDKLTSLSVFMRKIGSGFTRKQVRQQQPGIEKFWKQDREFSIPFTLGLCLEWVTHRDLIKFADKFELIGSVRIRDGFKHIGSFGYCSTFEEFRERFENLIDRQVTIWKSDVVAISDLVDLPASSKLKRLLSL